MSHPAAWPAAPERGDAASDERTHMAEGLALLRAGRVEEALACFRRALDLAPGHAGTLHLLGSALQRAGRWPETLPPLEAALAGDPANPIFHASLALSLKALGRLDESERSYRRALRLRPNFPEAWSNLANVCAELGRLDAAEDACREAIRQQPGLPEAHNNLGAVLERLGGPRESLAAYRSAASLKPGYAQALRNVARVASALGEHGIAAAAHRDLLAIDPRDAEAWHQLAVSLQDSGDAQSAVEAYRKAVALEPERPLSHNNLGVALQQLGLIDESLRHYRGAIAIAPDYAGAHSNLGLGLKAIGAYEEAADSLDRAVALNPEHAPARSNRALIDLTFGRFARGWQDYLWREKVSRWRTPKPQAPLPGRLAGIRLHLFVEQGLGDELFFLRFASLLKARGAWLAYNAHPKIAGLVARLPFLDRVIAHDESAAELGTPVALGDLPYLSGSVDPRETPPVPLTPLAERLAAARERLGAAGPPPYLGVTWRAGAVGPEKLYKAAPLDRLAAALAPSRATIVVLQRAPDREELGRLSAMLGRPVADMSAANDELEDVLALVSLVDDYVTVSNTNVHLRAGAGGTCRVLVPHPPEFRWMAAGDRSAWFPHAVVYHQHPSGDWSDALARLARDLAEGRHP